ncbi:hypothetical protein [Serratia fonticola]|uniref:hypothetical protein n=1 Tax=Serratia fonticola TaxID=47917 RepID=UPI003AB0A03F
MVKIKPGQHWDYANYTFRTGTRPFTGIEMILSTMIENFTKVTSHPCGAFSATNDRIARNAISDTAIVMSYSLLEGFFHEEYEYYVQDGKSKKPGELSALINTLLHAHKISLRDWRERRKVLDLVKDLRNAVVHSNGQIDGDIYKEKCIALLQEDLFEHSIHYPTLTFSGSLWLLREFQSIADEYSESVFNNLSNHLNAQAT